MSLEKDIKTLRKLPVRSPLVKGENVNLLSESEWRMIHNALSAYHNHYGSITITDYAVKMRSKIQQLMDKVRDNYIAPYVDSKTD